jgi:peptidyl-prolyl cis-trans isomerase D
MAKQIKPKITSKKHLARLEKERIQRRNILIGMLVVILAVVAAIGYGIIDQLYLQKLRPVATVNGEKIATNEFQALTRYNRQRLVNSATQTYDLIQYFGNDTQTIYSIVNQLAQLNDQLVPEEIGQATLDILIDTALIRQEATKRGITVSQTEIDQFVQEAFGYYPQGTYTPTPTNKPYLTSTLSPTQYAMVSPTALATATSAPTVTTTVTVSLTGTPIAEPTELPTQSPTLTPTPYTEEGYQNLYQETLKSFQDSIDFSEKDFTKIVYAQVYREKLKNVILEELNVSNEQEQVWARHILVVDETVANEVIQKLADGEDWTKLCSEYSTDSGSKDTGGDLNWFGKGMMIQEFEDAAFGLKVGETSKPIQTQYGFHIIQALGHETRKLSDREFEQLQEEKFTEWLSSIRDNAEITIDDTWVKRVPLEPALPAELVQFIQTVLSQQSGAQATPQP